MFGLTKKTNNETRGRKKMSKNGIIMCEDPVHRGLYGALYAMEDFLKGNDEGKKYIKIFKKNHYFLIKKY